MKEKELQQKLDEAKKEYQKLFELVTDELVTATYEALNNSFVKRLTVEELENIDPQILKYDSKHIKKYVEHNLKFYVKCSSCNVHDMQSLIELSANDYIFNHNNLPIKGSSSYIGKFSATNYISLFYSEKTVKRCKDALENFHKENTDRIKSQIMARKIKESQQ